MEPITAFVDELRNGERWAPTSRRCTAESFRVLSILRDPGPATVDEAKFGMLCVENDDPTAQLQAQIFEQAGVDAAALLPWNAYPWYINRQPTAAEMREGAQVIVGLVALLPRLEVLLLQGKDAQRAWALALKLGWELDRRALEVVPTCHLGRQALFHPDPLERERCASRRRDAIARVGQLFRA